MKTTRRSFLTGLLAAPFVARAEWLMPVKALPLPYLPGDLIHFKTAMSKKTGWYAVCEPLLRVDGQHLVFSRRQFGDRRDEVRVPAECAELFHGLPGNRVNNPSMRDKLIRHNGFGLRYASDPVTDW